MPRIRVLDRQEKPDQRRWLGVFVIIRPFRDKVLGGSLLVVSVNLPLICLSWTGCSVHPELISLLHVPGKPGHLTTPKAWGPGILLLFPRTSASLWLSDTKRMWFLLSKHMPREYHSPC